MHEANRSSPSHDRLLLLTDRERETLGLLFAGHDAKSAARHLGLSVHTINERLRDARRKLAVSTSREAARLVAEASGDPDSIGTSRSGWPDGPIRCPTPAMRSPGMVPASDWHGLVEECSSCRSSSQQP